MKCGAKCFLVEMEVNGVVEVIPVNARSPIEAKKNYSFRIWERN